MSYSMVVYSDSFFRRSFATHVFLLSRGPRFCEMFDGFMMVHGFCTALIWVPSLIWDWVDGGDWCTKNIKPTKPTNTQRNKPIEKLVASVSSSILAKISQSFGNYPPISSPTLTAESSSASSDWGVSTAFCGCVFAISEASALIVFPGSSS